MENSDFETTYIFYILPVESLMWSGSNIYPREQRMILELSSWHLQSSAVL